MRLTGKREEAEAEDETKTEVADSEGEAEAEETIGKDAPKTLSCRAEADLLSL